MRQRYWDIEIFGNWDIWETSEVFENLRGLPNIPISPFLFDNDYFARAYTSAERTHFGAIGFIYNHLAISRKPFVISTVK
jgi:hypothetical protein